MKKIIWPSNIPINKCKLDQMTKFVESHMHGLLPVYRPEYAILNSYAKENNIEVGQLLSIRNQLKIQREIKKSKLILLDAYNNKIIRAYNDLISDPDINLDHIQSFYARTNLPVLQVLKLLNKQPSFKSLDHHIIKKFYQVVKDITKLETKSKNQSAKFESRVEKFISGFGVTYQTEEDIRYGKIYTLTPDILFDSDTIILVNDLEHKIRWLDAKNYICMGHVVPFIMKSLTTQAEKYTKMFGPGAFVFRYGFVSDVNINNTLLLDGSALHM